MKQIASKSTASTVVTIDKDNLIAQFELPLIIFLLKKLSNKEHPLSVGEIKKYMQDLTLIEHSDKTLRRKIQNLCFLQNDSEDSLVANSLFLTFGGYVAEVTNEGPNIQKKQSKYYFRPLLDASDVSMICGAITSNRYLTAQEKDYLLSREQLLADLKNDVKQQNETFIGENGAIEKVTYNVFSSTLLPEKPVSGPNSGSKIDLLHHINQLHDAIEKGYAIQIIYGAYTLDFKANHRICLKPRNQKAYLLNPYALLWNGGFYYLLATHRGHENPVHFRVDRIMTIKPMPKEDDARVFETRAALPETLKPYFQSTEGTKAEFLPEKYTAMYPLMGIYDETDRANCLIECTGGTLSILIDTFGENLSLHPSPLSHSDDELDIHGNSQQFYAARIQNVQYDNILQFCLQQHASITALYPPRLVDDIEAGLLAALERCKKAKREINLQNPLRKKS